jgi:hypothetical protein
LFDHINFSQIKFKSMKKIVNKKKAAKIGETVVMHREPLPRVEGTSICHAYKLTCVAGSILPASLPV